MIEIGLITLIIPFVASIGLTYRFIKVRSINKKVEQILTTKNSSMANRIVEELGLGTAFIGSSIFDMYSVVEKNENILNVIEQRYPNEMGEASTIDWIKKTSEGEDTIGNYEVAYVGQKAEIDAIERLKEIGYSEVEKFPSKTHPDHDIKALDSEGNEILFSVKSYSDIGNFKDAVRDHPDAKNYIVNDELYNQLDASGKLEEYKSSGIEILNGQYSHLENMENVKVALEDVASSTSVVDDVGAVAIAFLGVKTTMDVSDYFRGKQSIGELKANVGGNIVGVGTRGAGGAVGAEIGAVIGTVFFPGIGTVAGGIVGAITGAMTGGKIAEDWKEKKKWGDIMEATEYFGKKYVLFFDNYKIDKEQYIYSSNAILKKICHTDKARNQLQKDKKNLRNLSSFVSRIGLTPRTLKESLVFLHIKELKKYLKKLSENIDICFEKIKSIISEARNKFPEEDNDCDIKICRCIGELIIENREFFINTKKINAKEKELLTAYSKQLKKNPNYPYKFFKESNKDLTKILHQSMATGFMRS